jgi:hypothetical protein
VIGCTAALMQSLWRTSRRPEPVKVVFNVFSDTANAIFLTYWVYHFSARYLGKSMPLLLLITACTYFLTNTAPVAMVIALSERRSLRGMWAETYFWSLPYYLIGAAVVGVIHFSLVSSVPGPVGGRKEARGDRGTASSH